MPSAILRYQALNPALQLVWHSHTLPFTRECDCARLGQCSRTIAIAPVLHRREMGLKMTKIQFSTSQAYCLENCELSWLLDLFMMYLTTKISNKIVGVNVE